MGETSAPRIITSRLLLRAHRMDDFEASLALWSDRNVTRYIGGKPSTGEEVWSRLLRYAGLWPTLGYGYWAICDRSTGRFLGELGLADFCREIEPPLDVPEAGWALIPTAAGRGYAAEALEAVLGWTNRSLSAPSCVCLIDAENIPSIRLAERAGFSHEGTVVYRGSRQEQFRRAKNAGR